HDLQQVLFSLLFQDFFQLEADVEMVFNRSLATTRDHDDLVAARGHCLLNAVLNDRLVYQRQHLLGLSFGRGQKSSSQSGCWENGFADIHHSYWPCANVNGFGCSFTSKRRAVISQHGFTNNLQRHAALLHQPIVKFQEAEIVSAHFTIILSQLENLQLAKRVHEISWIAGAPFGFDVGYGSSLESLFDKEFSRLIQGHVAGVQLYAHDVSRITQQRILQLSQTQFKIAVAITFVEHHLLTVVRPSFGVGS